MKFGLFLVVTILFFALNLADICPMENNYAYFNNNIPSGKIKSGKNQPSLYIFQIHN